MECEHARLRTAVGRAYYAVFLTLKARIVDARPDRHFPTVDAHRKLREALESVLGDDDLLVAYLKKLLRERKRADYELRFPLLASEALEAVHHAYDALRLVDQLSATAVAATANELFDNDRGLRRLRSNR